MQRRSAAGGGARAAAPIIAAMTRTSIRFAWVGGAALFASAAVWGDPAPVPAPVPAGGAAPAASRPAGQVRGTIFYGRRTPAVGVVVVVRPEGTPSPVYAASTGVSGTFAFDGLRDGTYTAEVHREGYRSVVKPGIAVRAPFRAVVEVVLTRGEVLREAPKPLEGAAALSGRVRVAGGAPLAEARVRLARPDAADDPRSALTDASGSFSFPGLKAGRWRVEVQGAGLLPLRTELDLAGDVALDAALARQPANYQPLPQDLIVPEDVIPPPGS